MAIVIMTVEIGAGDDFFNRVVEAVNDDRSEVYVQIAGEYGHLYVESIEKVGDE